MFSSFFSVILELNTCKSISEAAGPALLLMARLRRRPALNMAVSALFVLALGTTRGDLTGRLVDDSDTMANIVGASETQSLVDFKLHKVRRGTAELMG